MKSENFTNAVTGHGLQEIQPTIPRAICHAKDIASVGWNVSHSLSHSFSSVFGAAFSSWIDDQNTVIGILHWSSSSKSLPLCSPSPSGKLEGPSLDSDIFVLFSTPSVFYIVHVIRADTFNALLSLLPSGKLPSIIIKTPFQGKKVNNPISFSSQFPL